MYEKANIMSDRQRVEALLNHKKPDRVPIWLFSPQGFAEVYNNLPLIDAYTNPQACYYAQRRTCNDLGWVFCLTMGYAAMGAWEFGEEVRMPGGSWSRPAV